MFQKINSPFSLVISVYLYNQYIIMINKKHYTVFPMNIS